MLRPGQIAQRGRQLERIEECIAACDRRYSEDEVNAAIERARADADRIQQQAGRAVQGVLKLKR